MSETQPVYVRAPEQLNHRLHRRHSLAPANVPDAPRSAPRYSGKSPDEVARLIRAEMHLITAFLRAGADEASWACHACDSGRVVIRLIDLSNGREIRKRTSGICTTPGCLNWED